MPQKRRISLAVRLVLSAIVTVFLCTPLSAVAADPTPRSVGLGTPVGLSGNGFNANESLSAWAIGPDGGVLPISGVHADATGGFSTTISFPASGQWQVTVHSTASGKEFVGLFAVAPDSGSTASTIPPLAGAGANSTAANAPQVAVGAPVTVSASGFTANESISLWETAPGGSVAPISTIQADTNGAFSTTVTFSSSGEWLVTARGATSGKTVIGTYQVGPGSGATTASPTAVVPTNAVGSSAPQVVLGAPVTFTANGFTNGESISVWETGPDSTVTPLSSAHADDTGGFSTVIAFQAAGYWQVTAQGRTSGHAVVGGYNVTGGSSTSASATASATPTATSSSSLTSPYTRALVKVSAGSVVNFSASGFNANEIVDAWTTAPDGTVAPLDAVQASAVGQTTVSASFATAGLWQVTLHGRVSGHEVLGKYQVSSPS